MITPEMVQRRLIFDAMGDPAWACRLAGLVGTGEDGHRAETAASQERLARIMPVMALITDMSDYLAGLATATQLAEQDSVPEDFAIDMQEMYKAVITSSVVSIVSVLADLGVLSVRAEA